MKKIIGILAFSFLIKSLLFWGYLSTDFEVHRNWMAITYNLPLSKWYYEATSIWTMDYPPVFAYFEKMLSAIASFFDKKMLEISSAGYISTNTIAYQRATVIFSELILAYSVYIYSKPRTLLSGLILLNPGLIFVDHIHFQYNGVMIGMLILSIYFMNKEKYIESSIIFTILLLMKHIFLYFAPAYFLFLLKHYCFKPYFQPSKIIKLGISVLATSAVILFPFMQHLPQILSRLFPFGRGLTHAYWAPNIYSLYNTFDAVLNIIVNKKLKTEYMQGLVQVCNHAVLFNITPMISFILLGIGLFFVGKYIWKYSGEKDFCISACICCLTFFMFGWHVHEKAILMVSLPIILISKDYPKYAFLLNFFGNFSLFPLIFTPLEEPFLLISFLLFTISFTLLLDISALLRYEKIYLYFSSIIYFIYLFFNKITKNDSYIPLLSMSIYCGIGISYIYFSLLKSLLSQKNKKD
ncbi:ALG8 [Blepharisma stoltei]|uniref:Alpha-1,3-glucosyltransferase n=1 Tax=Blepharisma stoltei TaxID=1481888 RepID=A0AAU9K9X0_9CILI|nr:unnamed protein product [Blepharisma stoltei]